MNTHSQTAYLLAWVDTSTSPPSVVGAHIYSSGAAGLTRDFSSPRYPVEVARAPGDCFHNARIALQHSILGRRDLHWIVPLLSESAVHVDKEYRE